jgi:hypothetical protein
LKLIRYAMPLTYHRACFTRIAPGAMRACFARIAPVSPASRLVRRLFHPHRAWCR